MNKNKGFTLIELLLVVMIIGFMLAVILPRGLRATTDAKYNLVRQNCAELAAYGNDWIEQQILAQDADSTASRTNYLRTLTEANGVVPPNGTAAWIADTSNSNWNDHSSNGYIAISGRNMNNVPNFLPENSIEEIIDPAKILRNPFNGASVFLSVNEPNSSPTNNPIPGAIACSRAPDSSTGGLFDYYALIFQGTDSKGSHENPAAGVVDFHAGMSDSNLPGIREGVFFTKVRQ